MIFQGPPPFEPTDVEAEAITNIGFMFADILIFIILIVLMIYLYKKIESNLPMIVVFLTSLILGMEMLSHGHTHFSPMIEIFFLLFQTSIFLMKALESYKSSKKKKRY